MEKWENAWFFYCHRDWHFNVSISNGNTMIRCVVGFTKAVCATREKGKIRLFRASCFEIKNKIDFDI